MDESSLPETAAGSDTFRVNGFSPIASASHERTTNGERPTTNDQRRLSMTIRRLKTYTGSQGYVYQYYFVGKRSSAPSNASSVGRSEADEYIFDVTSDRKLTYAVSILLSRQVVAEWANVHGRPLSDSEQYAAVKMRLFRAFDEVQDPQAHGWRLQIDSPSLEESLASLGVE